MSQNDMNFLSEVDSIIEESESGSRQREPESLDESSGIEDINSLSVIKPPFEVGFDCCLAKNDKTNQHMLFISEDVHRKRIEHSVGSVVKNLITRGISVEEQVVSKGRLRALQKRINGERRRNRKEGEHGERWLRLLKKAYKDKVSDIHIQVRSSGTTIRVRIHGSLIKYDEDDYENGLSFASWLYENRAEEGSKSPVLNLKIPQNASIAEEIDGVVHKQRLATYPDARKGIDVVLRLLEPQIEGRFISFEESGYAERQCQDLYAAFEASNGMIIFTGETGSGKSTSMGNGCRYYLKTFPDKKVLTCEDPVENLIDHATQYEISTDALGDGAWSKAIRGMLRCDPDMALIGEIRDLASAEMAIGAAMTGHPVVTSLHANNPVEVFLRFKELGVNQETLASPGLFRLIVNQTLLQTLCDGCKLTMMDILSAPEKEKVYKPTMQRLEELSEHQGLDISRIRFKGSGCKKCSKSVPGVTGRTVVAAVMKPSDEISLAIKKGDIKSAENSWKKEYPNQTITHHALEKVLNGVVDPMEAEYKTEYFTALVGGE